MLRFLLNGTEQKISDVNPNISLLNYLRDKLDRVGSKEGCASGDCGACTVVVGELKNGQIEYSAINACITPVGNIHGKQLITVEDLKTAEGLHPVQQAMVDSHGSQCGFCTPGFVMSMFAYRKNNDHPERESIIEALGGNLCRCTGYRPIIEAAEKMYESGSSDQFTRHEASVIDRLLDIARDDSSVELGSAGKHYYAPSSSDELAHILCANPEATLVAGGTDLSLEITQFLREIDTLVYTGRVQELLQITESDEAIEIGAAVCYSTCKDILCREYPDLHELIDRLGSRQIRNQGTLGGNVGNASPIGDMPPVLIAVNAQLLLRSATGSRSIAVEDYFISYKQTALQAGEFIESITVPRARPGYTFRAYKVSKRLEDDISAVCGIFYLCIDKGQVLDASIAFGGMAEIPRRAERCEQALRNQPWTQATVDEAMTALAKDYTAITDFRASANYRQQVAQNLLQRLFLETQANPEQIRVTRYA